MDDEIDKSLWLPKDEPILNEFRLAKPDIIIDRLCDVCSGEGEIERNKCSMCKGQGRISAPWRGQELDPIKEVRHVQAGTENILKFLVVSKNITEDHAHDARTYQIWYEIFRATSTMEKRQLFSEPRGVSSEGLSEYGFVLLIQKLPREHHDRIKGAIYTLQTPQSRFIARRMVDLYITSFDKLGTALQNIRQQLKSLKERQTNDGEERREDQ